MQMSKRRWLCEHREVVAKAKPVEIKQFIKRNITITNKIVEIPIKYPVYEKSQTKKIKCREDKKIIDFFLQFGSINKISSLTNRSGQFDWRHSDYPLAWRDLKRHMFSARKGDKGRFGLVADKYDRSAMHRLVIIDVDCQRKNEYWTKMNEMKRHYDDLNIGTVVIGNIDETTCKGFHIYIFLRRQWKQPKLISFLQQEKQNESWIDKFYPNDQNCGIRAPFDYDRKFIDYRGKLVNVKNMNQLMRTIDRGSSMKNIQKLATKINVVLKNAVVKKATVSQMGNIKFRGKMLQHYKNMYTIDGYDDYNKSGSGMHTFAFKWNSGVIKCCVMRGDTNSEILNHIGKSLYVQRRFADVCRDDWHRIIEKCRKQVDDVDDPINKIWHENRPYADAVIKLWESGICDVVERKEEFDVEPDIRCVKKLAVALSKFNYFDPEKCEQYARFMLIVCKRDRSPRQANVALLKRLGLPCGNDACRDLTEWMRENGFVDAPISRAYGIATSYRATSLMNAIIDLRDEIAAVDLSEADELVSAIDAGHEDEIIVCYFILLQKLRNIPEYLLTPKEKILLSELCFLKYAMME